MTHDSIDDDMQVRSGACATWARWLSHALPAALLTTAVAAQDATHFVRLGTTPTGEAFGEVRHPSATLPVTLGAPTSSAGPGGCTLFNGGFHHGLLGWTVSASAGGPPDGVVELVNGAARLREEASFLTELGQTFCVPPNAVSLSFDLVSTSFDRTDQFIPDAFEVSLLDAGFQSVVPTWAPFATSYFNVQEDGAVNAGPGVTVSGMRVTVDLTGIAAGTTVLLAFDLIGADGDRASAVVVDDVLLETDEPGVPYCFGIACPCGNDSPTGGCLNSTGVGATLTATGSTSVTADDLVLRVEGVPPSFAYVFLSSDDTCTPLGDGLLAVTPGPYQPALLRFFISTSVPGGAFELGPGIIDYANTSIGAGDLLLPGTTWYMQAVYRDGPGSPCQRFFNLTNALRVTFGV